jgi:hypothetical protein
LVLDVFIDPNPAAWRGEVPSEPVVTCWGVFESDEQAKEFIQYYGVSVNMRNRQLFGIPMYEWSLVESYLDFEDSIPELYHDKVQEKMVKNHIKKEGEEVAKYSQECAIRGHPVPAENQEFDPEKPNFAARMWSADEKELVVTRGAAPGLEEAVAAGVFGTLPAAAAFPTVPAEPDFLDLPHGNPDMQLLADAATAANSAKAAQTPKNGK